MSDDDRESDKAWARDMLNYQTHELKVSVTDEQLDALADYFADAFQNARRQSAESIGDIQVKAENIGVGREYKMGFRVYVGSKQRYACHNQDIGILLGLGYKYLGLNADAFFAKMVGRMLGIEDERTK